MARIAGINVPDDKHAGVSLTYIFGIGRSTALRVCAEAGIDPTVKIRDLTEQDLDAVPRRSDKARDRRRPAS